MLVGARLAAFSCRISCRGFCSFVDAAAVYFSGPFCRLPNFGVVARWGGNTIERAAKAIWPRLSHRLGLWLWLFHALFALDGGRVLCGTRSVFMGVAARAFRLACRSGHLLGIWHRRGASDVV